MILIYVHNNQGASTKLLHVNQQYIIPVFHQKWPLFAPDVPNYNSVLRGRYFSNGSWSDWVRTQGLGNGHYKISHLEATLARDLSDAINSKSSGVYYVDQKPQFDILKKGFPYVETYFYFNQYFHQYLGVKPDSVQICLDFSFTPNINSGMKDDPIRFKLNALSTHE